MLNDITIGQFFPGTSFIHRMDARVKLVLTVVFIVFIFIAKNFYSLAAVIIFTAAIVAFSGISPKLYFKGLKAIWFLVIFTAILNMFYMDGTVLWQWWKIKITVEGLYQSLFIMLRLVCLIITSSALTYTTSPTDLTAAIERLFAPLSKIGFKVHELAMMMTIALRFVPTLLEETQKIMDAQKARGADLESGSIIKKVKALVPVLIPLFVSSLRRAFDLAVAMECRCYNGGEGRTHLKVFKLHTVDYIAIALTIAVAAGIVILNIHFGPIVK
ncbi:MAG: energy-coupling factor transporter transmembrane protein EcfT [Clostridia bacterium]|nr:energy-coupling factor transporter transmembrane protein EcfT [Clostridia bacterium]